MMYEEPNMQIVIFNEEAIYTSPVGEVDSNLGLDTDPEEGLD